MRFSLIAIGTKPPVWVVEGFNDYSRRMPRNYQISLTELPLAHRSKSDASDRAMQQESQKLLDAIPKNNFIVALDSRGESWSTEQLADRISDWSQQGQDVALLIGGPDGLSKDVLNKANLVWSLSKLTLPHALVRIFIAEQLYRAVSVLHNHPYHK